MRWIKQLICALTRHRYVLEKKLSRHSRKIGCTRCGQQWAMNDDVRCIVPWDDDFERLYQDLETFKKEQP